MRSREEIARDARKIPNIGSLYDKGMMRLQKLVLEVLLDVRDELTQTRKTLQPMAVVQREPSQTTGLPIERERRKICADLRLLLNKRLAALQK